MAAPELTGERAVLTIAGERTTAPSARPALIAGLFGALDAAFILCRAPSPPVPFSTHRELILRAFTYVLVAALVGAAAASFFWRRSQGSSFRPLSVIALSSAAGSVLIPPAVLLFRQDSPWLVLVTAIAAAALASCWRAVVPLDPGSPWPGRTEMFTATLQPRPRDFRAFWLALGIYAAGFELADHDTVTASGLLAVCGFALAWQLTLASDDSTPGGTLRRRAAWRLLVTALPAILITFLALQAWNPRLTDASVGGAGTAGDRDGSGQDSSKQNREKQSGPMGFGLSGYQSIILWPIADKTRFVMPAPPGISTNFDRFAGPRTIRFDGSYWYFQQPQKAPGPEAKVAHGTPLAANVRSNNLVPLSMEAHQKLGTRIRLAYCNAIVVEVENCDRLPGNVSLGLALSDSRATAKAHRVNGDLYLGLQSVVPATPAPDATVCVPRIQALRFPIPDVSPTRKFDEIKVIFSPDPRRSDVGAKMAVKQFELVPR
jgi:hypothetical protein